MAHLHLHEAVQRRGGQARFVVAARLDARNRRLCIGLEGEARRDEVRARGADTYLTTFAEDGAIVLVCMLLEPLTTQNDATFVHISNVEIDAVRIVSSEDTGPAAAG